MKISKQASFFTAKSSLFTPICLLLTILLAACAGDRYMLKTEGEAPPVLPEITMSRGKGGAVNLAVKMEASGPDTSVPVEFLRSIMTIKAIISDGENALDSLDLAIASGGKYFNDSTVTFSLSGADTWNNLDAREFNDLYCTLIISNGERSYRVSQLFDLKAVDAQKLASLPIVLTPEIEIVNDSTVIFSVAAKRNRELKDFFLTSEHLRVEIIGPKDNTLWSSHVDKMFSMVSSPVEPLRSDEVKRYELTWDGKTNRGTPLPPGSYTVNMILMAKPRPYTGTTKLVWKGGK